MLLTVNILKQLLDSKELGGWRRGVFAKFQTVFRATRKLNKNETYLEIRAEMQRKHFVTAN